jgi:cation:H+ antiporter
VAGAELIVRAGVRVAALIGVPPIVIGLTIVAIGTSTPELAIGIEASQRGEGSFAVANVAGTNVVNLLLILGLSALLRPLALTMQTLRFDLPVMALVAVAFAAMAWNGRLSRLEGGLMVGAAALYTAIVVILSRRETIGRQIEFAQEYSRPARGTPALQAALSLAALAAGIAVIVLGSSWLLDGAVSLARSLEIPNEIIALTVVAVGTSTPELATAVIATLRNDRDIAIGNLLGSSIYNILVILGITCLVPAGGLPVDEDLIHIDIPLMTLVVLACVPAFLSGRRVSRAEGALFVGAYLAYVSYLIVVRT